MVAFIKADKMTSWMNWKKSLTSSWHCILSELWKRENALHLFYKACIFSQEIKGLPELNNQQAGQQGQVEPVLRQLTRPCGNKQAYPPNIGAPTTKIYIKSSSCRMVWTLNIDVRLLPRPKKETTSSHAAALSVCSISTGYCTST